MKVLVCDDDPTRAKEAAEAINLHGLPGVEVDVLAKDELTQALEKLFKRVEQCMGNPKGFVSKADLKFDNIDIAIFDNNLAHLDFKGVRLTAESIVGFVRAFTPVPYIVSLNKNPDVDFDLRYLIGDVETRADLALNTDHLENRGLWDGRVESATNSFLPWYWPTLTKEANRRRQQIAFVAARLSEKVFAALGIPLDDESSGFLSLHARGVFSADNIGDVTFYDFFRTRARSLPDEEERKALVEAAKGGNDQIKGLVARVVAADIDLWFRRDVVAPQEMIVDVAHMLTRLPFLLGEKSGDVTAWNAAAAAATAPYGLDPQMYAAHIGPTRFPLDIWLPHAAFFWPKLKGNEELNQKFFNTDQEAWLDAAFCEDRSLFVSRSAADPPPSEFATEFEGSWGRRYVQRVPGLRYEPPVRFSV